MFMFIVVLPANQENVNYATEAEENVHTYIRCKMSFYPNKKNLLMYTWIQFFTRTAIPTHTIHVRQTVACISWTKFSSLIVVFI